MTRSKRPPILAVGKLNGSGVRVVWVADRYRLGLGRETTRHPHNRFGRFYLCCIDCNGKRYNKNIGEDSWEGASEFLWTHMDQLFARVGSEREIHEYLASLGIDVRSRVAVAEWN